MSLFNFSLKICCFLPAFALSLALSVPSKPDGLLALTQPSRLTVPVNTSVLAESSTIGDILRLPLNAPTIRAGGNVDCDWYRFGNPPAASCKDAVDQIPQDPATMSRNPNLSYGPRGPLSWDVNLPSRYISSDGKCIIDLTQTSFPSHVRYNELIAAGWIIQQECIEKDVTPWGGQARDMGDERNFLFTVQSYAPPFIRCTDTPPGQRPETTACQTILNGMKVSEDRTTFGAVGILGVDEHLPQVLTDPTGKCTITIDVTAPEDASSWYDLWQTAVALNGMCARSGKVGKARLMGVNRKLVMEIKKS